MDIISHGLWAVAFCKALRKKLNLWFAFLWGMFPDAFAFLFFTFYSLWTSGFTNAHLPHDLNQVGAIFTLTNTLYAFTHSIAIFAVVFGFLVLVLKRTPFEMVGWLLHILIDIPTHATDYYPTPFLWPLSNYTFNGIPWENSIIVTINYILLVGVFVYLYRKNIIDWYLQKKGN